jgi:hypothetical protein
MSKYLDCSPSYVGCGVEAVDWYPEGGGEKKSVELRDEAIGV